MKMLIGLDKYNVIELIETYLLPNAHASLLSHIKAQKNLKSLTGNIFAFLCLQLKNPTAVIYHVEKTAAVKVQRYGPPLGYTSHIIPRPVASN